MSRVVISDNVVVGDPPDSDESVRSLASDGFQSILNLRPNGISAECSSREEGVSASEVDLTYLYQPIAWNDLDEFQVESVRAKLSLIPKPVFVHADDSPHAAALCLIDRALAENWSGDEALRRAEALGLELESANLRDIIRQHVDRRPNRVDRS